jgi:hypothetical protein
VAPTGPAPPTAAPTPTVNALLNGDTWFQMGRAHDAETTQYRAQQAARVRESPGAGAGTGAEGAAGEGVVPAAEGGGGGRGLIVLGVLAVGAGAALVVLLL